VSATFRRNGWFSRAAGNAAVPRQALTFTRLRMPELRDSQLRQAMLLQLTQYVGAGPFAFVCKRQSDAQVAAWTWSVDSSSGFTAAQLPEPLLDEPAAGLRLVRRSGGFEAQHWRENELHHSRWFPVAPDLAQWQNFARGCGFDPAATPQAEAFVAATKSRPERGWLAGNSLPVQDPWRGWRWQLAVLLVGALVAAAGGFHWQTREQLTLERQRLVMLRASRESVIRDKNQYEQVQGELQILRALTPRLIQLELMDRVVASGVFGVGKVNNVAAAASSTQRSKQNLVASGATGAQLVEWDYRNGQLKLTLDVGGADLTMLEITRRLERIPGLGPFRVGQDASVSLFTLSTTVDEVTLAAPRLERSRP
jgi:hypothetical protein